MTSSGRRRSRSSTTNCPSSRRALVTRSEACAGTIGRIDADGRVLTVTADQREEVKVRITDGTKILLGAKAGALADLKSGDTVAVSYETRKGEREENSATRVTVTPKE